MEKESGSSGIRLNKYLALSGRASRRQADQLVFEGHVHVNGKVNLFPGTQISPGDEVRVDGIPISITQKHEYIILNKPPRVLTTLKDPQGRKTVLDLLPAHLKKLRLFPVGRLDYFSEGLLLMTNDGELANQLAHPRYLHEKVYEVRVRGKVGDESLNIFRQGMTLRDGTLLQPVDVSIKAMNEDYTDLVFKLREGKNRQIRRMCETVDLVILKLVRISLASICLGNLQSGKWRKLNSMEIKKLKNV